MDLPATVAGADPEATYTVADLSIGGAFLAGPPAAEGTELQLSVELPEVPLSCRATVRWVRARRISSLMPEGMGVQFNDLAEADRERLQTWIEEHTP